jgi:hypothetical protein
MTLAKWLTLIGLGLNIIGVLVIGLRGEQLMSHFWRRSVPTPLFKTQVNKWINYGSWWAIAAGFALQAAGVLVQK